MDLEVRIGDDRRPAGIALDDADALEDMKHSHRMLAEMEEAGLFSLQDEIVFSFHFHFLTAEDWKVFLERPKAGGLEADEDLLNRVFAPDGPPDARIVGTEQCVARAYAREDH